MLKEMSTGRKLYIGFSLSVVLVSVLGLIGVFAVTHLAGQVKKLGSNRLPTNDALQEIKIAAEQIKVIERTLLNSNNDNEVLKRQFVDLEKARKSYRRAIEFYESLPRTPKELEA